MFESPSHAIRYEGKGVEEMHSLVLITGDEDKLALECLQNEIRCHVLCLTAESSSNDVLNFISLLLGDVVCSGHKKEDMCVLVD